MARKSFVYVYPYETNKGTRYRVEIKRAGVTPHYKRGFVTDVDAWEYALEQERKATRHGAGLTSIDEVTLAEAIDQFICEEGPRRKDIIDLKSSLKWWRKNLGSIYVHLITRRDIIKCRKKLEREPKLGIVKGKKKKVPLFDRHGNPKLRSPRSVQWYLAYLSILMNWAVEENYATTNPVKEVKKPIVRNRRKRHLSDYCFVWPGESKPRRWRDLSESEKNLVPRMFPRAYEFPRLVDAFKRQSTGTRFAYHPEWGLYYFMLRVATGVRHSEALCLTWEPHPVTEELGLPEGVVFPYVSEKMGLIRYAEGTTKNNESNTVPLTGLPLLVVREMYKNRSLDTPFLFSREDGEAPIRLANRIRAAIEDAGLVDFTVRDMRHCTASYLRMQGHTLQDVMGALNHKSIQSSMRYQDVSDEHTFAMMAQHSKMLFEECGSFSRFQADNDDDSESALTLETWLKTGTDD